MKTLSLNGAWRVTRANTTNPLPARVPGCIHTDLLAAKAITDPFYRDHETAAQWVGAADWIYSRTFLAPLSLLRHARVMLRCEGLDTLATIRINGKKIARTDNMFRTWEFDVRNILRAGPNDIAIRFASTIPYIRQRHQRRALPNWTDSKELSGRSWIRKEPCNYGWDWGPSLITCGIWRSIRLVAFDTARLTGFQVRQNHSGGRVQLAVTPEVEAIRPSRLQALISVSYKNRVVAETHLDLRRQPFAALAIPDPQLWWPNTLGAQPLYTITVTLLDANRRILGAVSKQIGLRTLRLDRHPDAWGESFQFVVNGRPFFAKGGNWIPADTFASRMTRDRYANLLTSVAKANMNMIRLWGGGIYEADDCQP